LTSTYLEVKAFIINRKISLSRSTNKELKKWIYSKKQNQYRLEIYKGNDIRH